MNPVARSHFPHGEWSRPSPDSKSPEAPGTLRLVEQEMRHEPRALPRAATDLPPLRGVLKPEQRYPDELRLPLRVKFSDGQSPGDDYDDDRDRGSRTGHRVASRVVRSAYVDVVFLQMTAVFKRRRFHRFDVLLENVELRKAFLSTQKTVVGLFFDRRLGDAVLDEYLVCFKLGTPIRGLPLWQPESNQSIFMSYVGERGSRPAVIDGVQYWAVPNDRLVTRHTPGLRYGRIIAR